MLIVTGVGTTEVEKFVMLSARPISRVMILETAYTSDGIVTLTGGRR
jgi:hypothetical protein